MGTKASIAARRRTEYAETDAVGGTGGASLQKVKIGVD